MVLIYLESKVNAMDLIYAIKLGLSVQKTKDSAQKNNSSSCKIYGIVIVDF